ncbi:MAG: hypothetical protein J6Q85_03025 [Clostridia bacterium]|nr:hypothetical protein [Clostridia bacterium]
MKNRKVIVTAFLLIAAMILGVGYAAISDTLFFSGDATISDEQVQSEFDLDIGIVATSETNGDWKAYDAAAPEINIDGDLVVDITGTGDNEKDNVDFQIFGLADEGDEQIIWFKVENKSLHDANLAPSVVLESGTGDYFEAVYKIYESDGTTEATILEAGGSVLVKLSVTVKGTPAETYQGTFSFNIHAEVVG